MGTVYIAEHELLGKKVAIKVLLAEHSRNPELVQRFFNEARAATRINHPGIVEIFDFGHDQDGSAYIVMECLRGESLAKRLEREHIIEPRVAVRLMKQIANALGHAHRSGIIHRDLKPDNIFVVPDPDVPYGERTKLLDFGIAKLADDPTSGVKTRAGAVIGTPAYMAPEQFRGSSTVDRRRADRRTTGRGNPRCVVRGACARRVSCAGRCAAACAATGCTRRAAQASSPRHRLDRWLR